MVLEKWVNKALAEASKLASSGILWKEMPKWVRFRMKTFNIIMDYISWDAIKSGWIMPRIHFKQWKFYRKHPYLKKLNGS